MTEHDPLLSLLKKKQKFIHVYPTGQTTMKQNSKTVQSMWPYLGPQYQEKQPFRSC